MKKIVDERADDMEFFRSEWMRESDSADRAGTEHTAC